MRTMSKINRHNSSDSQSFDGRLGSVLVMYCRRLVHLHEAVVLFENAMKAPECEQLRLGPGFDVTSKGNASGF